MPLRRITLRDFVIVEHLELDFNAGFSALTGETGAGKSILVDALQLALGSRADMGVVREGSPRTDVCAEFDCPEHVKPWLAEAGIDIEEQLLLRRTVDTQSKSRAWINGVPVTATQLRMIGGELVTFHGQHAWQNLMQPESVRALLDGYAGISTEETRLCWAAWRNDKKALAQAQTTLTTMQQERERLQWQIAELEKLAPKLGEWAELDRIHTRLSHANTLAEVAQHALQTLEDESSGVLTGLTRSYVLLQNHEHIEPQFAAMAGILASSLAQANDVAHTLQSFLRHVDIDPARLALLDTRISHWLTLARRYKRSPDELPTLLQSWKDELRQLDLAADLHLLIQAEATSRTRYQKAAHAITLARTQAAPRLAAAITQAMQGLGMEGGFFDVATAEAPEPSPSGLDDVAFLVAGHPGVTPKPIGKVASGGELSRISLAIAVTTSELGTTPTLIFDEVDSGVGGAVAQTVGRLMQRLGCERQVLAVTHLPQVAACADNHLMVSKTSRDGETSSTVVAVHGNRRVKEVARMLGGKRSTEASLAHAKEMLQISRSTPES